MLVPVLAAAHAHAFPANRCCRSPAHGPAQPGCAYPSRRLENFGNTCYCNSVLQTLYFCRPFRYGNGSGLPRCCAQPWCRLCCACTMSHHSATGTPQPCVFHRERVLAYGARLQAAAAASKQPPPENMLSCLAELFLQVGWLHPIG